MLVNTALAQSGKVEVIKDPQIDSLIARRLELSKSGNKRSASVTGYRVQIFSGSDRHKVYAEQTRFKSLYPNISSYISYAQPNYKIRVGDFRTKIEAEKLMNALRQYFPSLFIFSEQINLR